MLPRLSALTVLISCACSSVPAPSTRAIEVPTVEVDGAVVDEVVPLTVALIRAKSENPPGETALAVAAVKDALAGAPGVVVETAAFPPDDAHQSLLATLPGRDRALAPVVLFAHLDVVPADATEWSVSPHDGAVLGRGDARAIVGRGALDMLGMAALEVLTLKALARTGAEGAALERDLVVLVTGDEEANGDGIQHALTRWPQLTKAWVALTEGGAIVDSVLRPGEDLAAIAVAEKGLFQFRLEATGASGHGSTPAPGAAPDRVVAAAARVLRRDPRVRVTEPVLRQLAAIGRDRGGIEGVVLENGALARALAPSLFDAPATAPLVKDTCALTMLSAGVKENVVPAHASATFDCRLLPGTDPRAFHDEVLALVDDPRVTLTVLSAIAATGSSPDHALLDAWRTRLKQEAPAMVVAPILSRGATDCRFVRATGVPCYGFMPVRVTPEELDRLHGKDEQLRVVELEKGLQRMVDVIAFAARTR